jgi:hypothetical protein
VEIGSIIPILTVFFSFVMQVLIFYWINVIKVNSDEQVKQNEEIISLLKKIHDNTSNSEFH